MSKIVISIKEDMDPDNVLENIEILDKEMNRLEANVPNNCNLDEQKEIDDMMQANIDLREKVNDVSNLVRQTLIKINVRDCLVIFRTTKFELTRPYLGKGSETLPSYMKENKNLTLSTPRLPKQDSK